MANDDKQGTSETGSKSEALIAKNESSERRNNDTFWTAFFNHIKQTIPTALSYDFSLGVPITQVGMTHLGEGNAAPSTTSLLNTLGYLQFAAVIPTANTLGGLFGELEAKKCQLEKEANGAAKELLKTEISNLRQKISRTPRNGIIAGLVAAPTILVMVYAKDVLIFFRQDEEVAEASEDFFRAYAPFFSAVSMRLGMEFVLLTSNKQTIAMLIADGALLATIALQYTFAFELSQGLEGLGRGSGMGILLTTTGFTTYITLTYKDFSFLKSFFSWAAEDAQQVWELIKAGGPIILTVMSDILANLAINFMAGVLPGDALAMQNVATEFLNINTFITAASSQTTSLNVARLNGGVAAGEVLPYSVRRAAIAGVVATTALQLPLIIFVSSATAEFASLVGEPVDDSTAQHLMLLTTGYALIDALRNNMLYMLRALGDNVRPSIASSAALWLGVGASYALSTCTQLGVLGLPVGLSGGALLGTAILTNRLRHRLNYSPQLVTPEKTADDNADTKADVKVDLKAAESAPPVKKTEESSPWYAFFICKRRQQNADYKSLPDASSDKRNGMCAVM